MVSPLASPSITAGGPAPIVGVLLFREHGTASAVAVYRALGALISLAVLYAPPDRGADLDHQ